MVYSFMIGCHSFRQLVFFSCELQRFSVIFFSLRRHRMSRVVWSLVFPFSHLSGSPKGAGVGYSLPLGHFGSNYNPAGQAPVNYFHLSADLVKNSCVLPYLKVVPNPASFPLRTLEGGFLRYLVWGHVHVSGGKFHNIGGPPYIVGVQADSWVHLDFLTLSFVHTEPPAFYHLQVRIFFPGTGSQGDFSRESQAQKQGTSCISLFFLTGGVGKS